MIGYASVRQPGGHGECSQCGAPIIWAVTAKGKRQPIDPEPRPDGNLAVYKDHLGQVRVRVVTAEHTIETYERPGMPHAATCTGKPGAPIARTRDGAISLADARRRRGNANRKQGGNHG